MMNELDTSTTAGNGLRWRHDEQEIAMMLAQAYSRLESEGSTDGRLGFAVMRFDPEATEAYPGGRVGPRGVDDIRNSPSYLHDPVSTERAQMGALMAGHVALGDMAA